MVRMNCIKLSPSRSTTGTECSQLAGFSGLLPWNPCLAFLPHMEADAPPPVPRLWSSALGRGAQRLLSKLSAVLFVVFNPREGQETRTVYCVGAQSMSLQRTGTRRVEQSSVPSQPSLFLPCSLPNRVWKFEREAGRCRGCGQGCRAETTLLQGRV